MLARFAYATQFAMTAAMGVVFAQLEDLQERYGLPDVGVGLIASTAFVASFVTLIVLSPLVDRGYGARIAVLAVISSVAGGVGFTLATSTIPLAMSRGLLGMGMGMFTVVARKALIGTELAGGMKKVGMLLSCAVAGFIAGPPIGAALGLVSFHAPFVVPTVAVAAMGIPAAVLIARAEFAVSTVQWNGAMKLMRSPKVRAALLAQVALWMFIGLFDATIDLYTTDVGLSDWQFALGLLALGLPLLVLPARAGVLAERVGATTMFVPAFIALVPAVFLYGFIGGLITFVLIGLVEAVVESFAAIGVQGMVLEVTGVGEAATGTGMLEAVGLLAAAVAAFTGPTVFKTYGAVQTFALAALVTLVLVSGALLQLRRPVVAVPRPAV